MVIIVPNDGKPTMMVFFLIYVLQIYMLHYRTLVLPTERVGINLSAVDVSVS